MYRVFTNFNVTSVIGVVVSERCGNMDDGEEIRLIIILSATFYCCFALWEGRGLIDYLNFFLTACNHGCYKGRGDGWIYVQTTMVVLTFLFLFTTTMMCSIFEHNFLYHLKIKVIKRFTFFKLLFFAI